MTTKRVVIEGRVHGVGYRAWMIAQAEAMGVSGWVRNRADGTVEAVVDGPTDVVEELLRACRLGPRGASVSAIQEFLIEAEVEPGFHRRPTLR